MTTVVFDDRAVAFIDVLGFRALTSAAVSDPATLERLGNLVGRLESAVPNLDRHVSDSVPMELVPQHLYVSDSIILSAPISVTKKDWNHYNGLAIIVMRAIQLTHAFAANGYLVRGGISIGKVWHTKSNIVGPAYIEAYQTEQSADMPRILLTSDVRDMWNRCRGGTSRMRIDYRGAFMVNGLFDYYVPGPDASRAAAAFSTYQDHAASVLSNCKNESVLKKWRWFKQYLDDEFSHVYPA